MDRLYAVQVLFSEICSFTFRTTPMANGEVDLHNNAIPIVSDLAKALLQIQQGIDSKYLSSPLGIVY
jgi:hypothetical protein